MNVIELRVSGAFVERPLSAIAAVISDRPVWGENGVPS
jgi:hypothetical protein